MRSSPTHKIPKITTAPKMNQSAIGCSFSVVRIRLALIGSTARKLAWLAFKLIAGHLPYGMESPPIVKLRAPTMPLGADHGRYGNAA